MLASTYQSKSKKDEIIVVALELEATPTTNVFPYNHNGIAQLVIVYFIIGDVCHNV